jgi:prepilin-type N-terminal cleavage/methylation domain-containing protein
MKKNYEKGFTLIELLVVIAIIGILSSVVLASLNSARDKGANAAVKGNLNGIRAQAELHYDNNNYSYATLFTSGPALNAYNAALRAVGGTHTTDGNYLNGSSTGWMANVKLKNNEGFFCVDSTGKAATTTNVTSNALCP